MSRFFLIAILAAATLTTEAAPGEIKRAKRSVGRSGKVAKAVPSSFPKKDPRVEDEDDDQPSLFQSSYGGTGVKLIAEELSSEILSDPLAELDDEFAFEGEGDRLSVGDEAARSQLAVASSLVVSDSSSLYMKLAWAVLLLFVAVRCAQIWRDTEPPATAAGPPPSDQEAEAKVSCAQSKVPVCPPISPEITNAAFEAFAKAAAEGNQERCLELLKEASLIRAQDPCGCTALHIAAHHNHPSVVEALLKQGADVNAVEAWEESPLHFAARAGGEKVCEVLVANGAKVNAINSDDWTPLLIAGKSRREAVIELLLNADGHTNGISARELPPMLSAALLMRVFMPTETASKVQ